MGARGGQLELCSGERSPSPLPNRFEHQLHPPRPRALSGAPAALPAVFGRDLSQTAARWPLRSTKTVQAWAEARLNSRLQRLDEARQGMPGPAAVLQKPPVTETAGSAASMGLHPPPRWAVGLTARWWFAGRLDPWRSHAVAAKSGARAAPAAPARALRPSGRLFRMPQRQTREPCR